MNHHNFIREIDIDAIREEFPILREKIYGHDLIYLDNAATTHKPLTVIDCIIEYYKKYNANPGRSMHFLSSKATSLIDDSRRSVQKFINAQESSEIIFTSGATESINLVASSYAKPNLKKNDEVLISAIEHHSNILPWQRVCDEKGAKLCIIPIGENGELDMDMFGKQICKKTKIVSICHVSNVLGTINPIKNVVSIAKDFGAVTLIDSTQAFAHIPIDVQALGCDFLVASAHKSYGPTGVGVLYAKTNVLEKMPPYKLGGGMIASFSFDKFILNEIPHKFEAGTQNSAGIVAFKSAIDFISEIGLDKIQSHEKNLKTLLVQEFSKIDKISLLGDINNNFPILSITPKKIHSLDLGVLLDSKGIAVRTGNLCAEPVVKSLDIHSNGILRISCAIYNTTKEILETARILDILISKHK